MLQVRKAWIFNSDKKTKNIFEKKESYLNLVEIKIFYVLMFKVIKLVNLSKQIVTISVGKGRYLLW